VLRCFQRHLQKKRGLSGSSGKSRKIPGHALIPGEILLSVDPHYILKDNTILFNIF